MAATKRQDDTPLYQQVKDYVVGRILAGHWPEGGRLPSENEPTGALGVSRMTAHRALRDLSAEGWLTRVRGDGTYVAEAKPQSARRGDPAAARPRRARALSPADPADLVERPGRLACPAVLSRQPRPARRPPGLPRRGRRQGDAAMTRRRRAGMADRAALGLPVEAKEKSHHGDAEARRTRKPGLTAKARRHKAGRSKWFVSALCAQNRFCLSWCPSCLGGESGCSSHASAPPW